MQYSRYSRCIRWTQIVYTIVYICLVELTDLWPIYLLFLFLVLLLLLVLVLVF